MKKLQHGVCCILAAILFSLGCVPAYAVEPVEQPVEGTATITMVDDEGNVEEYTFDISELVSVQYDADGNMIPEVRATSLSRHTIEQGGIRYYYTTTGAYFDIRANTSVTITVSLSAAANVDIGYARQGQSRVAAYSGISKNPATTFTLTTGGYYCFFLKNYSDSAITVTGGTINF